MTTPNVGDARGDTELRIVFLGFVCALVITAFLAQATYAFTPDSWSYFDLAHSLARGSYDSWILRQFQRVTASSMAFPPLWPAILAPFVPNWGGGAMCGLALVAYAGFAWVAELLGRRWFAQRGTGLLSALLMLSFPGLISEFGTAGSVPLGLVLFALAANALAAPDSNRTAGAIGLFVGLLVMARFDEMPTALVLLLAGTTKFRWRPRAILLMIAIFVLCIAPWVVYSLTHFHTAFATDNRVVALSVSNHAFVRDFHPDDFPLAYDQPAAWLSKIYHNLRSLVGSMAVVIRETRFLPILLLLVLVGIAYQARHSLQRTGGRFLDRSAFLVCTASLAACAALLATGYFAERYFTTLLWLGELASIGYVLHVLRRYSRVIVTGFVIAGVALPATRLRSIDGATLRSSWNIQTQTSDIAALLRCLTRAGGQPTDLVVFAGSFDRLDAYRFGALGHWRSAQLPSNWLDLGDSERATFIRRFGVRYWMAAAPPAFSGVLFTTVPCQYQLERVTLSSAP